MPSANPVREFAFLTLSPCYRRPAGFTGTVQEVTPICVSDPGMTSANMQYVTLTVRSI